ncbi:MAG: ribonuclease HI family protein [Candidatus Sumerlaeaceae bacterium]
MPLDRETKKLLQKALSIQKSEVPFYRVLDILATRHGDISEVFERYPDIADTPLRTAFHHCAELLRHLAKIEGLMPAWELEGPSTDVDIVGSGAKTQKSPRSSSAARDKKIKAELAPFVDESVRGKVKTAKVYIDGASRGNPGPAGIGFALFDMDGRKIAQDAKPIGTATNNVAEYCALIEALKTAIQLGIEQLFVLSDSELLVKQMKGEYRIKNADLYERAKLAHQLAKQFSKFSIDYISRENNKLADALSNYALDIIANGSTPSEQNPRDGGTSG